MTFWLQQVDAAFDRAQLQDSHKIIAIQSYLTDAAAVWFRFNKSKCRDWTSFCTALTTDYRPTIQQSLLKLEARRQSSDESVLQYYYDKLQLCHQVDPRMSDHMVVHYLLKGLYSHLIPHVIRRRPINPDEFLRVA